MASTHINAVLCASVPSAQNGRLPMKLAPKVSTSLWTPLACRKALSESYTHRTQFHAKSVKNDLKHTDFLKHNFYFKTDEYELVAISFHFV
jgi:hypothetical protein